MNFAAVIEKFQSNELHELHQLIFKNKVTDPSQIKRNLRSFLGFSQDDFEENLEYVNAEFEAEDLIIICRQLGITSTGIKHEDSRIIIRQLTPSTVSRMQGTSSTLDTSSNQPQSSMEYMNQQSTSRNQPVQPSMDSISQPSFNRSRIHQSVSENNSSSSRFNQSNEEFRNNQQASESSFNLKQQSAMVHRLKNQLIDLEEEQMNLEETSEQYVTVSKKMLFLEKRIHLEEERKAELMRESTMQYHNTNDNYNNNFQVSSNLHSLLIKSSQNLKLNDFNGSSSLDWHYFALQYNTSTSKFQLSNDENIIRLNEHIKGDARRKVELLLKSCNDPSSIMRILETHYGGNSLIVKDIQKRVRDIKKINSLEHFKDFNTTLQNISSVVNQLQEPSLDENKLQSILIEKLPDHFISQWGNHLISKNLKPKTAPFSVFTDWMNYMAEIISEVAFHNSDKDFEAKQNTETSTQSKTASSYDNKLSNQINKVKGRLCGFCKKEDHPLSKCSSFEALDSSKRFSTAKKLNFCIYCLNKHFGFCRKRTLCNINNCGKYHHKLLHYDEKNSDNSVSYIQSNSIVLLKMLPVQLKVNGKEVKALAFLDDGSTLSLIDKGFADGIELEGNPEPISFHWTGDIHREDDTSRNVSLEISGENSNYFFKIDNIHTVSDLQLPKQKINVEQLLKSYPQLENMNISKTYEGTPVLLLGQRHANLITNRHTIEIPNGGPFISKTKLGWAVHGPVDISGKNFESFVCCLTDEDKLDEIISKQYKLENVDLCLNKEILEDSKIVDEMRQSIVKYDSHYEINLPWKESVTHLPDSLLMAKQRLIYLEKKLLKDSVLLKSYQDEIKKLLHKEYARKIKFSDLKEKSKFWILPHFPVFNPKKPHKPARIVFDAKAKVENNSLNDFLHTGPDWLCSIIGMLIRFREKKIGFTGDIAEMFNRVKIKDIDTFAQCFLWRDVDLKKPIELYQMKAMLFGLNCAPFIAQFVKNYNAEQYKKEFPQAFKAITENHYVDDFVDCRDDVNEASKIIHDVIEVHKRGGFQIRSFISNNSQLIQLLPRELVSDDMFSTESENIQKVLGLFWNITTDQFCFLFKFEKTDPEILNETKRPTKKDVLQVLMTIFDPLGFLTPITIKAKILMQNLWKSKIGWNQEIPAIFTKKWSSWLLELHDLKHLQILRCYKRLVTNPEDIQLHVFCDASADSYCAVAYLRLKESLVIELSLVYSKSRVAPLSNKGLTIPKLELMGAVLAVRIAKLIKENLQVSDTYFWSDSMVILAWLNSRKYLKVFEKNRINEILNSSKAESWNWIPTKENLADLGTRDTAKNLSDSSWFEGPKFLLSNPSSWKDYFKTSDYRCTTSQDNQSVMIITENVQIRKKLVLPDITRFNDLQKLLRTTAWQLRYVSNLKSKVNNRELNKTTFIDLTELNKASNLWIRKVQQDCFKDDIDKFLEISNGSQSRLSRYKFQIDEHYILRLQGRTRPSQVLDRDFINPIILDGDHKFTKLIILDIHTRSQHFGVQIALHEFKTRFWMPKLTTKIKQALKYCMSCRLRNPQRLEPSIGDLIPERLRFYEKPFTVTGIDYFGPYYVKNKRSILQRYGVIFTCLTTRATHIEVAYSLTTDSCLMAIRRMVSRRGKIHKIISDNASNFRGASVELLRCIEELSPDVMKEQLVKYGIEWKFIPTRTPHFGGCWERMVGRFKKAITAVLPSNKYLTDEMLQTVFVETEYILNTRPYILESNDPEDSLALSPINILIPKFIEIDPVPSTSPSTVRKRQWRICEDVIDCFWNRFIKEYIPTILNDKLRKYTNDIQIQVGDLVYLKNKIRRGKWPIGKIIQLYPGRDGKARIVDVLFNEKLEKISSHHLLKINMNENLL